MAALGERFRAAREARGLSLSDVAEQIRIRSVYLGAIEDENWGAIGAPVYARGFLRTYARFLGLDPEEIVAEFNGAAGSAPSPPAASSSYASVTGSGSRNLSPLIWIASAIAVVLVAFVFYNAFTMRNGAVRTAGATPTVAAAETQTSSSPLVTEASSPGSSPFASASPSASPAAGGQTLELRLSAPSWVRVAVDGNVSMEGTFPAGTARVFHGKNAVLVIGNAGGVDVIVDGKTLGKLGASGDVVQRTFAL